MVQQPCDEQLIDANAQALGHGLQRAQKPLLTLFRDRLEERAAPKRRPGHGRQAKAERLIDGAIVERGEV